MRQPVAWGMKGGHVLALLAALVCMTAEVRAESLERDAAAEKPMLCGVDFAHTTRAQLRQDAIAPTQDRPDEARVPDGGELVICVRSGRCWVHRSAAEQIATPAGRCLASPASIGLGGRHFVCACGTFVVVDALARRDWRTP